MRTKKVCKQLRIKISHLIMLNFCIGSVAGTAVFRVLQQCYEIERDYYTKFEVSYFN